MRTLGLVGGTAATLVIAGVAMAATPSPTPTPAPTKAPVATPAPTKAPATTPSTGSGSTSSGAAASTNLQARVVPFDLSGMATVVPGAKDTATIRFAMQGLAPNAAWTVQIFRGGQGSLSKDRLLLTATRNDIDRLGDGTIRLHLDAAAYRQFRAARADAGVVILVSDGTRDALVTFPKA